MHGHQLASGGRQAAVVAGSGEPCPAAKRGRAVTSVHPPVLVGLPTRIDEVMGAVPARRGDGGYFNGLVDRVFDLDIIPEDVVQPG